MDRSLASVCAGIGFAALLTTAVLAAVPGPVGAAPAAGCTPSIVDLGDPFGGGFSYADGVNASGLIVGTAFLPDGHGRAVTWQDGHARDLGVVGKYDESFAHGVSADGTVVGELDYRQRKVAPFVYRGGRMRILPGLGGSFGYAEDINDHDVIVGTASDAAGNPHAVIWTNDGRTVHDLGVAGGDTASFASGINLAGTATGDSDDAAGNERPAVFTAAGISVLSTTKTPYGSAEDVNDHGRVIGISFLSNGEQHATVWAANQQRGRDLGVLPGGTFASLVDIDNAGAAVGGGNVAGHLQKTHAIYWPGSGGLQLLRPLSGHLYGDFAVARNLDPQGNAVGASVAGNGQIRGTLWTCAAAQAVAPRPAADDGTPGSAAVRLPAALTRGQ